MGVVTGAALGAAGVAAAAWLVVSFSAPGRRREIVEWIATCALYAVLVALFLGLCQRAWTEDRRIALVGFGLLAVMFTLGELVSLVRLGQTIRGRESRDLGATQ
jgi:hypothetical protein